MVSVRPFLWFDAQAEEARDFYLSVFKNGKALPAARLPDCLATFDFELEGLRLTAFNTGSRRAFNEAMSLCVGTADQAETDYYWEALLAGGGSEQACGWLTDRFGVYWQVVPEALPRLLADPDRERSRRVLQAMYKMKKIVVAELEAAYAG